MSVPSFEIADTARRRISGSAESRPEPRAASAAGSAALASAQTRVPATFVSGSARTAFASASGESRPSRAVSAARWRRAAESESRSWSSFTEFSTSSQSVGAASAMRVRSVSNSVSREIRWRVCAMSSSTMSAGSAVPGVSSSVLMPASGTPSARSPTTRNSRAMSSGE
ncbi:Uncharacterised protein [Mycobacteroides abscessus subsp. abscessus]|nr:Uncharacterised protein [Mycobacteroides abscessus subsp. abscessus]